MYELNIQADDELKEFVVSVKGTDDKFVSIAVAVAIDYLYDKEHQHKPMRDCLEVLQRCNALILCGNWRESQGCNQEYAAAYVMDMQIYEMKPTGEICSVE